MFVGRSARIGYDPMLHRVGAQGKAQAAGYGKDAYSVFVSPSNHISWEIRHQSNCWPCTVLLLSLQILGPYDKHGVGHKGGYH